MIYEMEITKSRDFTRYALYSARYCHVDDNTHLSVFDKTIAYMKLSMLNTKIQNV